MVEVVVDLTRRAAVQVPVDEVMSLITNVPDSISHFPELDELIERDGGYEWRLTRIGVAQISVQTIYGCRYVSDVAAGTVFWEPIAGIGNARVSGSWKVVAQGQGAHLTLHNRLAIDVPVPRLMGRAAKKIADAENGRLLDGYLANIVATLGGGDGRVFKPR